MKKNQIVPTYLTFELLTYSLDSRGKDKTMNKASHGWPPLHFGRGMWWRKKWCRYWGPQIYCSLYIHIYIYIYHNDRLSLKAQRSRAFQVSLGTYISMIHNDNLMLLIWLLRCPEVDFKVAQPPFSLAAFTYILFFVLFLCVWVCFGPPSSIDPEGASFIKNQE